MKKNHKVRNLYAAQFRALFIKDMLISVQGRSLFMILRMLIPVIVVLITYIIQKSQKRFDFSGIPVETPISEMKIPRCYVVADLNDSVGLGAKLLKEPCVTLGYYPENKFTRQIMNNLYQNLGFKQSDVRSFNSMDEFESDSKKTKVLFFVNFGNSTSDDFTDQQNIEKLQVQLRYNQTYADNPGFWRMYGDEVLSEELGIDFQVMMITAHTGVPAALQMHLQRAILQLFDIDFDPKVRSLPYISTAKDNTKPDPSITGALFIVTIALHFVFAAIQISQDKGSNALDAMRLAGMSDFIFWGEQFVFQMLIYLIQMVLQLLASFAMPGGNDMYPFMDVGFTIFLLLVGGLYATSLALLLNSFSTPKITVQLVIFFFVLTLGGLIIFYMFQAEFLYDPSIIPNSFGRWLVRWIYPFSQILGATVYLFTKSAPVVVMDLDSLDTRIQRNETTYQNVSFLNARNNISCTLEQNCTFNAPSVTATLFVPIAQTILFWIITWLFAEWLPTNASASRPPWKIFQRDYFDVSDYGFTMAAVKKRQEKLLKNSLDSEMVGRKPIDNKLAVSLLQEIDAGCAPEAYVQSMNALTQKSDQNIVLQTHHLHKTFIRPVSQRVLLGKEHYAVKSVNLQIHRGEIYGLAGHNGAGKSTTLNMITGAQRPDLAGPKFFKVDKKLNQYVNNGWVENQFDIRNRMHRIRRTLGVCPQFNTNVFQELSVYQNLRFVLQLQNVPDYEHDKLISQVLKAVGLYEWKNKKLKTLSGGMQRRISICMALINPQTRLIILDEPTTGLDPQTKRVIWSVIKNAARVPRKSPIIGGSTGDKIQHFRLQEPLPALILTSHDMMELDVISDNVGIMASGHLVAQGTPLHMKTRYGGGYTLSTIAFNRTCQQQFYAEFQSFLQNKFGFTISKRPQDEEEDIRIIDRSGAVIIFGVHQRRERELQSIVSFVEMLILNKQYLQDFTLERSSMDKVFITVGNMYDMENGATQFKNVKQQEIKTLKEIPIEQVDEQLIPKQIDIEYSEEQQKKVIDLDKLSTEEVQKILSPPRYKQQNFRAMMNKMMFNDRLKGVGIVSFVFLPIIFVIITYLLCDQLFPWLFGKMAEMLGVAGDRKDQLCEMCNLLKSFDVLMPECKAYNPWGSPNLCEQNSLFISGQKVELSETFYGGDLSRFDGFSLYNQMQAPLKISVFDPDNLYGRQTTIENVIMANVPGDKVSYSVDNTGISQQTVEYQIINGNGKFVNNNTERTVKQQFLQKSQNAQTFFDLLSFQAISRQQITRDNKKQNKFTLLRDMEFVDGADQHVDLQSQNNIFMRYLQRGQLSQIKLEGKSTVTHAEIDEYKANEKNGLFSSTGTGRNNVFYYLRMDEFYNFQQLQLDVVKNMPMAIDFSQKFLSKSLNESKLGTKFGPLIQALLPVKTELPFYDGYRHQVKMLNDTNFNSLISLMKQMGSEKIAKSMFTTKTTVRFAADDPPSVFDKSFFNTINTIPTTPLVDITLRLSEGLLRQKVSNDTNIQFSVKPYNHKYMSLMDLGSIGSSLQIGTLFITIGSLFGITKYGYHLVQDRQSGMRRQLYLNGVGSITYWLANLTYSFGFALLTMILVVLFGAGIFQLSVLLRINTGMLILLIIGGAFVSVSLSFLVASLLTHTAMFSAASVIVLIASIIIVLFNVDQVATAPVAAAYVLPSMAFVSMLQYLSFNGYPANVVFNNAFGNLYVWMIAESIIFILLSIYFDTVLPFNGYRPQPYYWPFVCFRKKKLSSTVQGKPSNVLPPEGGLALGDELEIQSCKQQIKHYPNKTELNQFPASVKITSVRDEAAQHEMSRMDMDVYAERRRITEGIPRSPVVVCNLQKIFGQFMALRDMSFHIPYSEKGTVFALLGPNGAAKTTTINLMVGLLPQTQGKVVLFGRDMETQASEVYPYLGLCSQFDVFLPNLSVREHLIVFAAVHGVKWADIAEVVENLAMFVQLGDVLDKRVGQLSGGMKRRMSLALALIG